MLAMSRPANRAPGSQNVYARDVQLLDIASVRAVSHTRVVIALRTGLQIERETSDGGDDLAERIRQRLPVRPASPPVMASPPVVVIATAGPPPVAAAAPQVVREVIERQIVVMRCAHCGELTPVDLSRCKNCGASISV